MSEKFPAPMLSRPKLWGWIAFAVLFSVWWGIPAFNKWRADKLVDELCAKDGGSEIYEVVKLPAEKFDPNWLVNLPSIEYAKTDADYYGVSSSHDIRGNSGSVHINDLVIWRSETKIVRASDKKVMAKLVSYTRRGGDSIGPWHPSHHTCPKSGFPSNVFVKQ
ncbi:MAG: hypothetical protein ACYC2R_16210 [Burkholderiales bacterium]